MNLDIYELNENNHYEIIKNNVQRDWIDQTIEKHGYKCMPITSINTHSWSVILKTKTVVHWSPEEKPKDIKTLSGPGEFNMYGGFISFQLPYIFKTDEDFYTIFFPTPNFIYKKATPLSFLMRSDWFPSSFQCAWKLHEPGRHVLEEGTPLISFMPYPKKLIDSVNISVYSNERMDESLYSKHRSYVDYMESEYSKIDRSSFDEYPYIYKKGILSENSEKVIDDPEWRPKLQKPERF